MVTDEIPLLFIPLPITFPLIKSAGFDPIWFGIMTMMMVAIGLVFHCGNGRFCGKRGFKGRSIECISRDKHFNNRHRLSDFPHYNFPSNRALASFNNEITLLIGGIAMKIMVIAPGSMSEEEIKMRQRYAESLCSSEIKITGVEGPPSPTDEATVSLLVPGIVKMAQQADQEGYDAVIIHCFGDIGLAGAKTIADIPVIGAGESVFQVAYLLADKFGLITARDEFIPNIYRSARTHGVVDRIVSMRSINIPVLELRERREELEARFTEQVNKAKHDGAEIIIVGCLAIFPALGDHSARRLSEKLGIQLLDGTAIALRVAEMLVNLNLRQSRLAFPRAAEIWHK